MSKKNTLFGKATRREIRLNSKQSKEKKLLELDSIDELTEKQSNDKVGVFIQLFLKTGEVRPVFFETEKNEFFEITEKLKFEKDIENQKEDWFKTVVFGLMEINPIDHNFFNAVVLIIATTKAFINAHKNDPNKPIGLGLLIQEGTYGFQTIGIPYETWQEIFSQYSTSIQFQSNELKAK